MLSLIRRLSGELNLSSIIKTGLKETLWAMSFLEAPRCSMELKSLPLHSGDISNYISRDKLPDPLPQALSQISLVFKQNFSKMSFFFFPETRYFTKKVVLFFCLLLCFVSQNIPPGNDYWKARTCLGYQVLSYSESCSDQHSASCVNKQINDNNPLTR